MVFYTIVEKLFQNVLRVDENNIAALYNVSTTLYDLGDREQLYRYMQRAYQFCGEDVDVANFYGLHFMFQGRELLSPLHFSKNYMKNIRRMYS